MLSMRKMSALLIGAALLGCGGGGGGGGGTDTGPTTPPTTVPPPAGSQNAVTVVNDSYQPSTLTVSAGTQVTWTWNTCSADGYGGQTCGSHSVTFDDGVTSPTQDNGTYSRTFTTKGTYTYHCVIHGTAMSGTITVS